MLLTRSCQLSGIFPGCTPRILRPSVSVGHTLHLPRCTGPHTLGEGEWLQTPLLLVLLWARAGLHLVILQMTSAGTQSHSPWPSLCPVGGPAALLRQQGDAAQGLWADAVGQSGQVGLRVGEQRRGPVGGEACVCGRAQPGPPGHRPDRRPPREPIPYHLCPVQEFQESLVPVVMK